MRVSKTISRLKSLSKAMAEQVQVPVGADRLQDLQRLTDNPGNLRGRFYVPEGMKAGAPLVVVLHGCTQTAAGYDHGSGWSGLADRHGFALLFPEQQRANNPNLCFNWFEPGDATRGRGEAASIRAMIARMAKEHKVGQVFVTGLSAGGAMASVLLAAYPEVFAGGAMIAGLPYGCASGVAEAFSCMAGQDRADRAELGARVRAASPHRGPWPRISVWQGSADHTVVPSNADAILRQWGDVHGLPAQPSRVESVEGYPRRVWLGPDGTEVMEYYAITGMAHGTPLAPGSGDGLSGAAGPHMLDAAISSTDRIAAFWGIAPAAQSVGSKPKRATASPANDAASGPQKVIEDALRAAGLMR